MLDRGQKYLPDAGLIGKGPFREVQLRIDGLLGESAGLSLHAALPDISKSAGVVYPFPVIYTGGANPLLWRPLASLRAFDVPSFFVDVMPYLPMCVRPSRISDTWAYERSTGFATG